MDAHLFQILKMFREKKCFRWQEEDNRLEDYRLEDGVKSYEVRNSRKSRRRILFAKYFDLEPEDILLCLRPLYFHLRAGQPQEKASIAACDKLFSICSVVDGNVECKIKK